MIPPLSAQHVARFRSDLAAVSAPLPLAIAVSGGGDSLALLLLAAAALPGEIAAATVNHGLRPEAAAEAAFVAGICSDLAVPHVTLQAKVDARRSSLQRAAREARYTALAIWMAKGEFAALATAHHADDQAETLMMRLLRGSGSGGLAGVRARTTVPAPDCDRLLIRPLLGWRRSELRAIVDESGIAPIDDPSNGDERFDRARIRRHIAEAGWLDALSLSRSAAALAQAEEALAWVAELLGPERIAEAGERRCLDPAGLPAEIVRRLVLSVLADCGAAPAPRGDELARLIGKLEEGGTATLAGVKCVGGSRWTFEREAPRRG